MATICVFLMLIRNCEAIYRKITIDSQCFNVVCRDYVSVD